MSSDHAPWTERKSLLALPDGRTLAYVRRPADGPVLVLLHGYTDTSRSYERLASLLDGYTLVIPDLPGHGASSARLTEGCSGFAEDVEALLDRLDIGRCSLVGHSMGGVVGTDLAARLGKRAAGLVLLASSLRPRLPEEGAIARGIRAFSDPIDPADPFFDEWHHCVHPVDPKFLAHARREAAAMPATVWRRVFKGLADTDMTSSASRVSCPVVCLGGGDDPLFGAEHQAALLSAFPDAEGEILAGHGHNLHWEDPDGIAVRIHSFLARTR
ncbi:alpha/beta hydrolase [Ciceribacter sp. L1K23]|uniref:alpha/beta fold hydrolase n=1 Tax=Ciceribacter sp. L1K23 TaxID=2820276 RepID=UPI001B834C00|nr:alpha/beta hydrolase [Ciceribacter sp. L1K23]MBR0556377.1 alpha/beta hydrolase [Ciceribacter sp. L1K23]